jgi:hypothetical protein
MKIFYVLFEKTTQITLAENDPVIQKLFPYRTVPPLDKSIVVGRAWWGPV